MRLFALVSLTMLAFAANSVLNRMGLAEGGMDATAFGAIRLLSGAVMLGAITLWRQGRLRLGGEGRAFGVFALLLYLFGFSYAYEALDAGLGALVLFGMVQVTMFAGGLIAREAMPARRWVGAGLALGGLGWLLWPGAGPEASIVHGLAMAVAGVGWGLYSLAGRRAGDPVGNTAANFTVAALLVAVPGLWLGEVAGNDAGARAVAVAVFCGAVTSGLGYALWYSVLPRIAASSAAVAQLTVPLLAMAGGMLLLGEALTLRFVLAAALVLGGVAVSLGVFGRGDGAGGR